MPKFMTLVPMLLSGASSGGLSSVVTKDLMSGVFDEIIALLPVCIPVMVSFIALRKGISFIQSILHSA